MIALQLANHRGLAAAQEAVAAHHYLRAQRQTAQMEIGV